MIFSTISLHAHWLSLLCLSRVGIHGKGFFLEHPRAYFTPIQQLKSILDNSPDISRHIRLAKSSFGDEGLNELQRLFRNRFQLGSI
jgi:hypothetical protein